MQHFCQKLCFLYILKKVFFGKLIHLTKSAIATETPGHTPDPTSTQQKQPKRKTILPKKRNTATTVPPTRLERQTYTIQSTKHCPSHSLRTNNYTCQTQQKKAT